MQVCRWHAGIGGVLGGLLLALAPAAWAQELNDDVQRLISKNRLGETRVGIYMFDSATGSVLSDINATEAFVPASNMKLLTTGAALLVLGPDYVFKTEIARDGDALIVRGGGDPALADPAVLSRMSPKLTIAELLSRMGGAVVKAGMTQVSQVVVDDRIFDRERVHAVWPTDQLDRGYCAEVAGVNFHANVLSVYPRPSPEGVGRAATYAMEPIAPWIRIDVSARTVGQGQNTAWLRRQGQGNRFELLGDVRTPAQGPVEVTLRDPAEFFGRVLAREIASAGIPVAGSKNADALDDASVRMVGVQERLNSGQTLAVVTTPMTEVMRRCNADSENLYAEALLKLMGHSVTRESGSWNNGTAVVRMLLGEKLSPGAAASTTVVDGSGLARTNMVTPATLGRWLDVIARDERVGKAFLDSLAEPGTGTLQRRFRGTSLNNSLRAKSGRINFVRTLSGYVVHESTGRRVVFVVLCNNVKNDPAALSLHEDIVKLADEWLTRRTPAESTKVGG